MLIQINESIYINPLHIISLEKFEFKNIDEKYVVATKITERNEPIYQAYKTEKERDYQFNYLVDDLESALERLSRKN